MKVIYIDTLFFINTAANYLLLLATAKICDTPVLRRYMALSAVFGGVYAVFACIPKYTALNSLLMKAVCAAVMVLITFGFHKNFMRIFCIFISVSAALGGIVYAVSLGNNGIFSPPALKSLGISFICAVVIIASVFRRTGKATHETHKVQISCFGKSIELTAFVDTGNNLKDPLSGTPAIIVGLADMKSLLPKSLYRIITTLEPAAVLESLSGTEFAEKFRLLPYSAVGTNRSMLLALRADVKIDEKPSPKTLIAISPTNVSDGGAYSALMGV